MQKEVNLNIQTRIIPGIRLSDTKKHYICT